MKINFNLYDKADICAGFTYFLIFKFLKFYLKNFSKFFLTYTHTG